MASKLKTVWIYVSLVPIAMAGSFWLSQNMRPNNSIAEETPTTNPSTVSTMTAQSIPVTATVRLGGETFDVEVAKTEEERVLSLRWRPLEDFPENRAMLLQYDPPRYSTFATHKLKFPVELITIKKGKIIDLAKDIEPCDRGEDSNTQRNIKKCPIWSYGPDALAIEVNGVLVVRKGTIDRTGIKEKEPIEIQYK